MKNIQSKFSIILLFISLLVSILHSQNNFRKDSLLLLLQSKTLDDTSKAKICNTIARKFIPNSPDSAILYSRKGAAIIKSDKKWKSNLINTIGVGFFYKSFYDSAISYYLIALKLREELGNEKLISSSYNNIAVIYQIKGETKKAMDYYFRNLKFREGIKDQAGIANVCDNIANLYQEQSDARLALTYQFKAIRIRTQLKDTLGIALQYVNIANSYDALNKHDSVYYYLATSIPILLRFDQQDGLAQVYNGLGVYYAKDQNPNLAMNYFIKSRECYKKKGDLANSVYESLNIGVSKLDLHDFKGALKECEDALPVVLETAYYEKLKYCYKCLYRAHKALKNDKEALKYHEKFTEIKDSLFNKERTKELTKIELTHEYNTKTEISELKHQKDLEIKEHEKKNQKILMYFIIVGLIVAVFLVFFTINRLKITKKQNAIIERQKKDVEEQKEIIMDKQKEILDSIHYAKRIQTTLLAHADFVNDNIPHNFILFKPKDIVSGDFYWATKRDHLFYLAVCDSTGHGVPGAFMSLLNIGFLSEAINEKDIFEPHEVFNYVRNRLVNSVSKDGQQDGFDGILLCINQKNKKMTYAAAHNAPIIVRENQIIELQKDKMPVGKGEIVESFTLREIDLQVNDSLYLYTDGYADQFGGPRGKKFLYKRLNELLVSLSTDELYHRGDKLNSKFEEWRGALEQVDDVLIIGIKLNA